MTGGYERFRRELTKAKDLGIELIILIEGSISIIEDGIEHSNRRGTSILKQLHTIWRKYDVPFYCFSGNELTARYEMSRFIVNTYASIGYAAIEKIKKK